MSPKELVARQRLMVKNWRSKKYRENLSYGKNMSIMGKPCPECGGENGDHDDDCDLDE